MTDRTAEQVCLDIFKAELEASEDMEMLGEEFSEEEIDEAIREAVNGLLQGFDSRVRKAKIMLYAHKLASGAGLEELAGETKDKYEIMTGQADDR